MSHIQVPPVTLEDLQAFQAKHFPSSVQSSQTDHEYYEIEEEEDDGLGYYPDGVKRTLTDEQIRIFRHSEIHALLREKQLREDGLSQRSSASPEAMIDRQKANSEEENISPDQSNGQVEHKTTTAGIKRVADETEPSESVSEKRTADASNAALDYTDEGTGAVVGQPPRKQAAYQFRRRIICYDD